MRCKVFRLIQSITMEKKSVIFLGEVTSAVWPFLYTLLQTKEFSNLKNSLKKEYEQSEKAKTIKFQIKEPGEDQPEGVPPPFFSPPRPISSPLEEQIYTVAFHEGVIEEHELLAHFDKKTAERIIYG